MNDLDIDPTRAWLISNTRRIKELEANNLRLQQIIMESNRATELVTMLKELKNEHNY